MTKSNMGNMKLQGWKVIFYITKFGNLCESPTWEPKISKDGRSYFMLPSLAIYVKVQHGYHKTPELESHILFNHHLLY